MTGKYPALSNINNNSLFTILNLARVIIADNFALAIFNTLNRFFARGLQEFAIKSAQTKSIDSQHLQLLRQQRIDLAVHRHQKDFQRLAICIS